MFMGNLEIICTTSDAREKDFSSFFELGLNWVDSKNINVFYITNADVAASVFSLGLICRDLCDKSKNDKELHFQSLINNAIDFLDKCKSCSYKCHPELAECNRFEEAASCYKKIGDTKVYNVESFDSVNRTITVSVVKKPTKANPIESILKQTIIESYSDNWYIHGKPSLIQSIRMPMLGDVYNELTQGLAVATNFTHSYSQLSFVSSNNQVVNNLNRLAIKINNQEKFIGELLTLANDRVSRLNSITVLNQEGLEFVIEPKSIIYSCLYSAMKIIDNDSFRNSEKFIFFDPTESEQKINEFFDYISSNRDWLSLNKEKSHILASTLGISCSEVIVMEEN
jgi:hypothetical protein